jgi:hypothetical protein
MRWGSTFFDEEVDAAVTFPLTHKGMAAFLTPTGQVISGAGISAQDLKDLTCLQFANFLFGAEEGHGTAQTFGIKGQVCFNISGGG